MESHSKGSPEIILRISKSLEVTEHRSEALKEGSLEGLIESLKSMKEIANNLLTVMVNEEKNQSGQACQQSSENNKNAGKITEEYMMDADDSDEGQITNANKRLKLNDDSSV